MKRRKPNAAGDENSYVAGARAILNSSKLIPQNLPPEVSITEIERDNVHGEWIARRNIKPERTIIYFHGGGYVGGSVKTYRTTTAALAEIARAKVFAVEYRLAPEHRFPAAVKDGLAAYKYVLEQEEARNIAFVGDSAGGGLLLATMLAAREENLLLPVAGVCYSPLTDLAATGKSLDVNDKRCAMFYGNSIRRVAPVYLGGADPKNPLASPLYADLSGLPPLQIFVSTSEVLLDDSLRLAAKAEETGVLIDLQVWRGLPHVWAIFAGQLPEARRALAMTAAFISKHQTHENSTHA